MKALLSSPGSSASPITTEAKQQDNRSCQALMQSMGLEQFNTHESDARMMRTPKGVRVANNVQTAVDAKHCLILHHEVTQDGDDRKQLDPMAKAAKAELGQAALTVTADMGYSNGQQFQACEDASITAYVPPNRTSNPGAEALFNRQDFTYDADQDRYQCPAGQWLTLKQRYKGDRIYQAAISDSARCALKAQCTTAKRRYVSWNIRLAISNNGCLGTDGSCCGNLKGREPKWPWL